MGSPSLRHRACACGFTEIFRRQPRPALRKLSPAYARLVAELSLRVIASPRVTTNGGGVGQHARPVLRKLSPRMPVALYANFLARAPLVTETFLAPRGKIQILSLPRIQQRSMENCDEGPRDSELRPCRPCHSRSSPTREGGDAARVQWSRF